MFIMTYNYHDCYLHTSWDVYPMESHQKSKSALFFVQGNQLDIPLECEGSFDHSAVVFGDSSTLICWDTSLLRNMECYHSGATTVRDHNRTEAMVCRNS